MAKKDGIVILLMIVLISMAILAEFPDEFLKLFGLKLSITEASCQGNLVWLKESLSTESSRLASLISDCQTNPSAGFVGTFYADAITPNGSIYRMGGYSATTTSTQKISCGTSQGGKEFIGATIPNEGIGNYQVKVSGKYYLSSENYLTAHDYGWTDTVNAQCLLPSTTCPDGTALRSCSTVQKGKWCTSGAYLIDYASTCGCPEGSMAVGDVCQVSTQPTNSPPPSPITINTQITQPTSSQNISTNTTSTTQSQTKTTKLFGIDKNYIAVFFLLSAVLVGINYIRKR